MEIDNIYSYISKALDIEVTPRKIKDLGIIEDFCISHNLPSPKDPEDLEMEGEIFYESFRFVDKNKFWERTKSKGFIISPWFVVFHGKMSGKSIISWVNLLRYARLNETAIILIYNMGLSDKDTWKTYVSCYQSLSEDFMWNNRSILNWHDLCKHQKFSQEFIEKAKEYLHFSVIAEYQELSCEFIRKNLSRISQIDLLLRYQKLDIETLYYITTTKGYYIGVDEWSDICKYQKLDIDFIERNVIKFNSTCFKYISKYQTLTEEFMDTFRDYISWTTVCRFQTLSEDFIESHSDRIDWFLISRYQNLSASFIESHKDRLDLGLLNKYQSDYGKYN